MRGSVSSGTDGLLSRGRGQRVCTCLEREDELQVMTQENRQSQVTGALDAAMRNWEDLILHTGNGRWKLSNVEGCW